MNSEKKKAALTFSVGIAVPVLTGILSSLLTRENMQLFETVKKPPLSPPAILFPIVWTVLYVLMGISSAIVWNKGKASAKSRLIAQKGLTYYAVSLVFNFAWSIIFFNLEAYFAALVWLTVMLLFIMAYCSQYKMLSRPAAYLQIPYIVWTLFAGYLNLGIALLNP